MRSDALNRLPHALNQEKLAVLCYHGVVPERLPPGHPQHPLTIAVDDFAEQLRFLRRWFHPVTASAVCDHYVNGEPLPRHALLVTFDDGYRNNLTLAAPLLEKYGFPAIVFIATGYIGARRFYWYDELLRRLAVWTDESVLIPGGAETRPWPRDEAARRGLAREIEAAAKRVPNDVRLEYLDYLRQRTPWWSLDGPERDMITPMTWDEVRALARRGFEIGSHTVEHPILSRLAPDALRTELHQSRERLEEVTGRSCFAISYPNGSLADISPAVIAATEAAGYQLGFTMTERLQPREGSRFLLARVSAPGHAPLGVLRVRASGLKELFPG